MTNKEKLAQIFPDGIEWSKDWLESKYYESTSKIPNKCEDAINRQMVLDTLDNTDKFMDEDRTVETYKALLKECYEVLPPVTPKQKMGHWEWLTEDKYRCSNCNHETRVDECMNKPLYDFCPFCGAKMEEEK